MNEYVCAALKVLVLHLDLGPEVPLNGRDLCGDVPLRLLAIGPHTRSIGSATRITHRQVKRHGPALVRRCRRTSAGFLEEVTISGSRSCSRSRRTSRTCVAMPSSFLHSGSRLVHRSSSSRRRTCTTCKA